MFDTLYDGNRYSPLLALGSAFKPPKRFEHGKDELVAKLKGKGDGYNVEVYEARMPACFYKLVAVPTKNSVGEMRPGFEISTGSGSEMGELIAKLAVAVSEGMVSARTHKR